MAGKAVTNENRKSALQSGRAHPSARKDFEDDATGMSLATKKNMRAALHEKQVALEASSTEVSMLREQLAKAEQQLVKKRKRAAAAPVTDNEVEFKKAAKAFTVIGHVNVLQVKKLLETPITQTYHERFRYDSAETEREGLVRELDDLLPPELQDLREDDAERLEAVFTHAQGDIRRTLVHRVRSHSIQIFGAEIGGEIRNVRQNKSSPLLDQLLGFDEAKKTYQLVPPLLRGNPKEPAGTRNMLNSEYCVKVLKACLFGPASLDNDEAAEGTLGKNCNASLWDVREVTAGAIAFAAIMAKYAISADLEFTPVGGRTQLKYLSQFDEIKKLLTTNRKKPSIIALFAWYNTRLFPNQDNTKGGTTISSSSSDRDELMQEFEAEEDVEVDDLDTVPRKRRRNDIVPRKEEIDEDEGEDEDEEVEEMEMEEIPLPPTLKVTMGKRKPSQIIFDDGEPDDDVEGSPEPTRRAPSLPPPSLSTATGKSKGQKTAGVTAVARRVTDVFKSAVVTPGNPSKRQQASQSRNSIAALYGTEDGEDEDGSDEGRGDVDGVSLRTKQAALKLKRTPGPSASDEEFFQDPTADDSDSEEEDEGDIPGPGIVRNRVPPMSLVAKKELLAVAVTTVRSAEDERMEIEDAEPGTSKKAAATASKRNAAVTRPVATPRQHQGATEELLANGSQGNATATKPKPRPRKRLVANEEPSSSGSVPQGAAPKRTTRAVSTRVASTSGTGF